MKTDRLVFHAIAALVLGLGPLVATGHTQGFCFNFNAPGFYPVGVEPVSVVAGDLDGDGDRDLAVANYGSNTISILRSNGDGTYAAAVNYSVGVGPNSVFAADLDGDADQDLAVANLDIYSVGSISILKNNGDGTFGAAVNYAVNRNPQTVFAADLDGDGDKDLAVANLFGDAGGANVSVLKNNGDGTFATAIRYFVLGWPHAVIAANLDGDGDLDLAVATDVGISVLLNNGDGTFFEASHYASSELRGVVATDLDGDGDQDLAGVITYSNKVIILKNNGDGTFATPVSYGTGTYPWSVVAADLDVDGDQDLVLANSLNDNVTLLQNNGDGTFATAVYYSAGANLWSVCAADLNGDGKVDLAVTNKAPGQIGVIINMGPGPDANAGMDKVLSCTVTQINLSGSSSTPAATFSWSASDGGHIVSGATTATPLVDAAGTYTLTVTSPANGCTASDIALVTGAAINCCDCPHQGDIAARPTGDGLIDVFDVIEEIGIAFSGASDIQDPLCPQSRGDVDNNGVADVFDVIYLIGTAFSGGLDPVNPCAP